MPRREDIPVGREHAVTRRALARQWNCTERDVRLVVAEMRREPAEDGTVILTACDGVPGYWRSDCPEEIRGFVRSMSKRARSTFVALRAARAALRQAEGQAGQEAST